jgi:YD repeat-containing protein
MALRPVLVPIIGALVSAAAFSQTSPNDPNQPARVNVTINPDGSRTTYQFDQGRHQAIAVTTTAEGKVTGKITYQIDEAGRFSSGVALGPNDKLLFKSVYRYTPDGRLDQETHLDRNDAVVNRLVYNYDANGRQTGYVVYDASGNVIGRTSPVASKPSPGEKRKRGR